MALLAASLVGPAGEVIGIDKAASAVETAQQRAQSAGLDNVSFVVGDAREMVIDKPL